MTWWPAEASRVAVVVVAVLLLRCADTSDEFYEESVGCVTVDDC